MKNFTYAICVLVLTLAGSAFAGKPGGGGSCSDVPIKWIFQTPVNAPAAIYDDGKGPYVGGVDKVFNSVIHFRIGNNCNGSRDATLGTSRSRRKIGMTFSPAIAGSEIESPSPSLGAILTQPFLNIRNLVGFPIVTTGVAATYYTKMSITSFEDSSGVSYSLVSLPDEPCPSGLTCVYSPTNDFVSANQNLPAQTAWVKVNYIPRDTSQAWSVSNTDQWVVEGEFTRAILSQMNTFWPIMTTRRINKLPGFLYSV